MKACLRGEPEIQRPPWARSGLTFTHHHAAPAAPKIAYSSIIAARATGRDVLDRVIAVLQERVPGYVFNELRPVDLLHESGRLAWSYGRPGQKPIKGVDVVLVRDGRISLMLTFLDEVPAKL